MMKKLVFPIFAFYLLTHVGCTSSDVQDKSDVAVSDDESFSEEAEEDFADGSESTGDEASSSEESQEEVADEGSGEEAAEQEGEQVAEEDTGEEEESGDELADETEAGAEGEEVAQNDELGDEFADGDEESEFPDEVADETEPTTDDTAVASNQPSDESLFTDSGSNNEMAAPVDPAPPKDETVASTEGSDEVFKTSGGGGAFSPLQKIRTTPFEHGGGNLNRVYLTRKGDTWKSVSEKIYGSDRSDDLKSWNSFNVSHGRELKTGEKVYYNSPKAPTDKSQMLTYYEDMGIPPQTYTSADGDNIREVSEKLLGSRESWKELWSTNASVESRGALPAGLELRYWSEVAGGAPVGTMASNVPQPDVALPPADTNPNMDPTANAGAAPSQPDPTMMPPIEDPMAGANPAPPSDVAANDPLSQPIDTSPPPIDNSAPPPIANVDTPPPSDGGVPSPDPVKKKAPATAEASPTGDADTTMMVGIAGVALLLLVGVIVIMRKNRSRRIDLSQTQV